jgi:RNA polymerase sigma-70 factor, ECF subfamily
VTERSCDPDATSRSLLLRAREGDAAAWRRLVTLVVAYVRRLGLGPADVEDVFQDVFQAAARKLSTFRRESPNHSFRAWLKVIALNKTRDHARRNSDEARAAGGTLAQMRLDRVESPAEFVAPESPAPDHAESLVLRRALDTIRDSFKAATWRAFESTVLEGRAPCDVAPELGMTAGAVRVAKSRVLQRLREELGDR